MIYYNTLSKEKYGVLTVGKVGIIHMDLTNIEPLVDPDSPDSTYLLLGVEGTDNFNQPIGGWNTSTFGSLFQFFGALSRFNQPIGDWDVSKVTDVREMFWDANSFKQDISMWDLPLIDEGYLMKYEAELPQVFESCPLMHLPSKVPEILRSICYTQTNLGLRYI